MAFDYVQIIISGLPITQSLPKGAGTSAVGQVRITRESRINQLTTPRGLYNSSTTYNLNDEVCYGTTFYRSIDATPFSGITPSEDGVHWTKSEKFDWAWPDASKVFILQTIGGYDRHIFGHGPTSLFEGVPNPLSRYDSKDEGKLSPDRRQLKLRDGVTVTGVDGNGNPVTYDFSTDQYKSFLGWLFFNKSALTTWSFNRVLVSSWAYDTKSDFEWYWGGESKNNSNTGPDRATYFGRTPKARQVVLKTVTIEGGINRYNNLVTADVFPLIALPVEQAYTDTLKYPGSDFLDMFGAGGAVQFVGGFVANQGCQTTDSSLGNYFRDGSLIGGVGGIGAFGLDKDWLGTGGAIGVTGINNGAVFAVVTSNYGLHYMTLDKMFSKFATRGQMGWNSANCTSPVTVWGDDCQSGSTPDTINSVRKDAGNIFSNTGFQFEAVFGSDPRCNQGVQEMRTPVSLGWNTPLSNAIVLYSKLTFTKPTFPIDQTTKTQSLVFTSLQYLNTIAGSTLSSSIAQGATSCTVASGSAFLTAATAAIGEDAATFLAGGGTIFAQFQYQGIAQTIQVTSVLGNTVNFAIKDASMGWLSGAALNPVRLLPLAWQDGMMSDSEPAMISARHVELQTKGDNDIVACPSVLGDVLTELLAHNVRRLGSYGSASINRTDLLYNTAQALNQQRNNWMPFHGGGAGGAQSDGRLCVILQAHVFNHTTGNPDSDNYDVFHAGIDARDFFTSGDHSEGNTSMCQWRDHTGQTGFAWITNTLDRNTFEIGFNDPAMPRPDITQPVDFLIGYTTGAYIGRNDGGWLFDITIGTTFGTPLDNQNVIMTTHRLDGQDIYHAYFAGMQIVLPAYGIFTITNITWDGTYSTLTLDRTIPYGATGVEGRIYPPQLASDGWTFACYLFYMNVSDKRFGAASYGSPPLLQDDFTNHYWTGFRNQFASDYPVSGRFGGAYALSRLVVGLPEGTTNVGSVTPPADKYGAAHYSLVQAFARRFIGIFSQAARSNIGIFGNDGTLTSWSNGDSIIEQREGAVRCYLMEGHEMSEIKVGGMTFRLSEWPDFSAPLTDRTFPVLIKGGGGTWGGAGGGGGTGAGGSTPAGGTSWEPVQKIAIAGAGSVQLTAIDTYYLCNNAATTGVLKPITANAPNTLVIVNETGADFTTGDFLIPNGQTWFVLYDGTNWKIAGTSYAFTAAGGKITNVAPGVSSTDAVNVSQLSGSGAVLLEPMFVSQ